MSRKRVVVIEMRREGRCIARAGDGEKEGESE